MQCTRTPVTNKHHLVCKHGHRWHATVEYPASRHPSLKHHNTITRLTLNANSTYSAPRALQGRKWMAWSGQLTMSTHAQARAHDRHNMDPHEARASRPLTHKDVNAVLVVPRMQMLLRRRRKGRAVAILRAARRQRLVTQPRTTDANIASGHFYLGTKDAIRSPGRSCEAGNRGGSRLQSTLSGDASIYRHRLQAHHIQQAALDWLPERRHTAAGRREKLAVTSSAAVFSSLRKPTDQAFPVSHLRVQGFSETQNKETHFVRNHARPVVSHSRFPLGLHEVNSTQPGASFPGVQIYHALSILRGLTCASKTSHPGCTPFRYVIKQCILCILCPKL
jgi:hypothetical protein